jgi:hypothetical protein
METHSDIMVFFPLTRTHPHNHTHNHTHTHTGPMTVGPMGSLVSVGCPDANLTTTCPDGSQVTFVAKCAGDCSGTCTGQQESYTEKDCCRECPGYPLFTTTAPTTPSPTTPAPTTPAPTTPARNDTKVVTSGQTSPRKDSGVVIICIVLGSFLLSGV